jgi:hypothetical protein
MICGLELQSCQSAYNTPYSVPVHTYKSTCRPIKILLETFCLSYRQVAQRFLRARNDVTLLRGAMSSPARFCRTRGERNVGSSSFSLGKTQGGETIQPLKKHLSTP